MLTKDTRFTKDTEDLILDKMSKRAFIVIKYLNQYAEGITGQHKNVTVYMNQGEGFKTKKEAKAVFKEMNKDKRFKSRLVEETPYGNIGEFYTIYFVTGVQLIDTLEYCKSYSTSFRNNEV